MALEDRARLVAALDHDARQPRHVAEMGLRNLRLLTAGLEMSLRTQSRDTGVVRSIRAELEVLSAAIRQVIDTQRDLVEAIRLEFGEITASSGPILADGLLRRVADSSRGIAGNISLVCAQSRLSFVSDERLVERVLSNLTANAILHSGGDTVLIGARCRGGEIVLEVRDNGFGIPIEQIANIFEPAGNAASEPPCSSSARTGLGLYNVKLLVDRLGGLVECVSKWGHGTLFRVRLPGRVTRIDRRLEAALGRASSTRGKSYFLGVLSKDLVALEAIESFFEQSGFEVYADQDPLRWLGSITGSERVPNILLLDASHTGWDIALYIDIVRRKWGLCEPKLVGLVDSSASRYCRQLEDRMPLVRKPIEREQLRLLRRAVLDDIELAPGLQQ
jgi:hypothetical protein